MAFTIQGGAGSNIPQIKETSINFLPAGNTILTASVNQISTRIKAVPFQVFGDINTKGIVFQVATLARRPLIWHYTNMIIKMIFGILQPNN